VVGTLVVSVRDVRVGGVTTARSAFSCNRPFLREDPGAPELMVTES
jgi:hypothetical protein